jgi:hypothetical protein
VLGRCGPVGVSVCESLDPGALECLGPLVGAWVPSGLACFCLWSGAGFWGSLAHAGVELLLPNCAGAGVELRVPEA